MELKSRWTEPKIDFLFRFSELVQVVHLYKQKVQEWRHKTFMRSVIYTFCKRLKSKQYCEIKIIMNENTLQKDSFDGILKDLSIKQMVFLIKHSDQSYPAYKLKTIRKYSENVSM